MIKKTRLIILFVCVSCFLVSTPVLVAYSIGYRFDFEKMRIASTGGIYVRTYPGPEQVIIDSKIIEKPGIFSNATFTQSLLPDEHTILAQKAGYYDYFKTVLVQEKEVTKLENIILFKKNIQFELVDAKISSPFDDKEKFVLKNNSLYYSNVLENIGISATQKAIPVIKNVAAFCDYNDPSLITWLGTDGILYQSNISNPIEEKETKISIMPVEIGKKDTYKLVCAEEKMFLIINNELFRYAGDIRAFEDYHLQANNIKASLNGTNIIYYYNNNIYYYDDLVRISQLQSSPEPALLYKSSEKISDYLWLNNYYIAFTAGDKIIISETDYRGNINTVTLPQTVTVTKIPASVAQKSDTTTQVTNVSEPQEIEITIKNPQIYFNQRENKLYILTGDNLLVSEKIIP